MSDRNDVASALIDEIVRLVQLLKTGAHAQGGTDRSALLLLVPLLRAGSMRLGTLADMKHADPSTVSRQVAELVRTGLVTSDPDPADGRARCLTLTQAGHQLAQQLLDDRCEAARRALAGWSDAKMARFVALLREFNTCVADRAGTAPASSAPPGYEADPVPHQRRTPAPH